MRTSWRRARAAAVFATLGTSARAAGFPDNLPATDEPIHLAYAAAGGCPTAAELVSMLRESTTRFRLAGEWEQARSFGIEAIGEDIAAPGSSSGSTEQNYVGRLTIRDVENNAAVREVHGRTCKEVVEAVAFIAALAIDPNAVPARTPSGESPTAPAVAAPAATTLASSGPPQLAPSAPELPPPSFTSPETRLFAAIRAGGISGVAPGVTAFARLAAEVSRIIPRSPWTASLSLSLGRGLTREIRTPAGVAHLTWTTGRLDACFLRWAIAPDAMTGLELCPVLEAGVISGTSTETNDATPRSRGWFSLGAVGRLALEIAGPVAIEVEGGATAPILRDHFYFSPVTNASNEVYRVPAVSFFVDAGVSVRIR